MFPHVLSTDLKLMTVLALFLEYEKMQYAYMLSQSKIT